MAKRAKVDEAKEAKEEEDRLVRRREELILEVENARAKGEELEERMVREAEEKAERLKREADDEARRLHQEAQRLKAQRLRREVELLKRQARELRRKAAAENERMVCEAKQRAILVYDRTLSEARLSFGQELRSVCATLEAKNEKLLGRLPPELWQKILDENVLQNDVVALAMTCRFFREKQKDLKKMMKTNLRENHFYDLQKSGKVTSHSLGWFQWVCDTFEILPGFKWYGERAMDDKERVKGAVYDGVLLNYAAFQGSVEILRWLTEEKGWELNEHTGLWAGKGGCVEVLKYLRGRGYYLGTGTCSWAASRGCFEALKFLRGLDPPCPWSAFTCLMASDGAHLDVLKWLRAQNPPCPWDRRTCANAVLGGRLEVLKWARSQDPPCPWSRSKCRSYAYSKNYQHVIDWIDQQEDESDDESVFSDSDSDRSYDSYDDEYF